ncbi:hypothetical protein ACHELY_003676 [Vibrio vulnificus]
MAIVLPCADGTDPQCWGRVEAEDVSESYYLADGELQSLFDSEAAYYTDNSTSYYEDIDGIVVEAECATCPACGSDYYRDSSGNIIID